MAELETGAGQWLSQSEAGVKLGWKLNKVIAARRSGRLQGQKGNRGEWLVFVPDDLLAGPEPGSSSAEADVEAELREELAEVRHALGRAEGRAEMLALQASSLTETLALERARADRLEMALAEARKPLLLRLVEAIKRG